MNLDLQQIESLILRHLSDDLSASEQLHLAAALDASEEARQLLASHLRVEATLLRLARGQELSKRSDPVAQKSVVTEPAPAVRRGIRSTSGRWIGIAVAMVVVVSFVVFLRNYNPTGQTVSDPQTENARTGSEEALAYVTRLASAVWNSPGDWDVGTPLTAGGISLSSGVAEIQFACGATVILEGPTQLDIVSDASGFLRQGRLHSHVPPEAFGFSMSSTSHTVVDLGTEFGMEVDADGATEVHVFDGEVEIYDGSPEANVPRMVAAGEALRFDAAGEPSVMLADTRAFVGSSLLELRSVAFVTDIDDQLSRLQRRQRELRKEEKNRTAEIRGSDSLKGLRSRVESARHALLNSSIERRDFQDAEAAKQEARSKLESLIDGKLADSTQGKTAIAKRDELEALISKVHAKMEGLGKSKSDRRTKKRLANEMQRLVRDRNKQHQKLRKFRQEIRKTDDDVKQAMKEFGETRRTMDRVLSDTTAPKLHRRWKAAKRQLSQELNRLLKNDKQLGDIQAHKGQLNDEIKQLRRKLKHKDKEATEITGSIAGVKIADSQSARSQNRAKS